MIKQRKIAKYVLLQIVTLGIYGLFFWSDWTEDLNKMSRNELMVTVKDLQVRVRKEMSSKRNTELELKKLRKSIFDVFLRH